MIHVATLNRLSAVQKQDGPPEQREPLARPNRPGRWKLTQPDGQVRVCRVIERNGSLYAVRGGLFAVAQPVDHLEGAWLPDD